MPYDILNEFCHNSVKQIRELSLQEKAAVGLYFTNKQKGIVEYFDNYYDTEIYPAYLECINEGVKFILTGETEEVAQKIAAIESIIPDSDEYPALVGTLTQIAFVEMSVLFSFYISKNDEDLLHSMEEYMNSLDMLAYDKDENYNEQTVFEPAALLLERVIVSIKNYNLSDRDHVYSFLGNK